MRPTHYISTQSLPRIAYAPRDDTSAQVEASILANIYALALQKDSVKQEATRPGSPDDAMKGSKSDRARTIIPNK
jgi:hypothetical protein